MDFDRYLAELERSEHDAVLKQQQLTDAQQAVARRGDDGILELEKLKSQRAFNQAQMDAAEVHAERAGTVVHGFNNLFGTNGRYEEGSSSYPGQKVGEVVGGGAMIARAWVLEPDRAGLDVGEKLQLAFDALPGRVASGTVTAISGASEAHAEWGGGRYFVVDIDIAQTSTLPLKPGMSVRVETLQPQAGKTALSAVAASDNEPVRATGDVYARSTAAITPPAVDDLWQLTITQMASDGQNVKKGDPVVSFDGGEVMKQLSAKQSELEEKLRTQEKLRLELADKARTEMLATAEATRQTNSRRVSARQPSPKRMCLAWSTRS